MKTDYLSIPLHPSQGSPSDSPAPWGLFTSRGGAASAAPPALIRFEITEHCSMNCPHCYIPTKVRHTAGMGLSLARVKEILDRIATPGQRLLLLGGEPFEREDAVEIIAYAKARGAIVQVITNAYHLDREKVQTLQKVGLDSLMISIYGTDAETHDAFTCRGSFARILEVVGWAREFGLTVDVSFTLTRQNFWELFKFQGFARAHGIKNVLKMQTYIAQGHAAQDRFNELTTPQFLLFWGVVRPFLGRLFSPPDMPQAKARLSACEQHTVPLVKPDGEVWSCQFYPRRFANLLTEGPGAVWGKLRTSSFDPSLCGQCVKRKCVGPVRGLLERLPQRRLLQLHGLYNRIMQRLG